MDVRIEHQGSVAVIAVSGSIDSLTAPELASQLSQTVVSGGIRLVADFREVDYTSSAGLRALLSATKEARAGGGDLRLAGLRPNVHKVLELSGFTSILKIYGEVDDAVTSFAS